MRFSDKHRREVEFEEFYVMNAEDRIQALIDIAATFDGRRTAYNRWTFRNEKSANEFMFMVTLKYPTTKE